MNVLRLGEALVPLTELVFALRSADSFRLCFEQPHTHNFFPISNSFCCYLSCVWSGDRNKVSSQFLSSSVPVVPLFYFSYVKFFSLLIY